MRPKMSFWVSFLIMAVATSRVGAILPSDDTFIDAFNPTTANGGANILIIRTPYSGLELSALTKFDLGFIPAGTTVKNATLSIYYYYYNPTHGNPVGRQLEVYRVTEDWDEDTVTYNTRPNYNTTAVASTAAPGSYGWVDFDVTSSVSSFVNGTYSNFGWKIMDAETTGSHMIYFRSQNYGSLETKLTLELDVIFVDNSASGNNDGSNWDDAFNYLQDGLTKAVSGDEIWVAQGTYYPDLGVGHSYGSRSESFQLKNGVDIYGGFTGSENNRDQRNWRNNLTILTGDIGAPGTDTDNCYHVVKGEDNVRLDGFVITKGYANGGSGATRQGAGVYLVSDSPALVNCVIMENYAQWFGGGIYAASEGFDAVNCMLADNAAIGGGGAVYVSDSDALMVNCVFFGNTGADGGAVYSYSSNPRLRNCSVSGNHATTTVGGIYSDIFFGQKPRLENCIVWGNTGNSGTVAEQQINEAYAEAYYSCIQDNNPDDGSIPFDHLSVHNIDDDPLFEDAAGDNLRLSLGSPCVVLQRNILLIIRHTTL